jgi:biotin synthase-like enzyme
MLPSKDIMVAGGRDLHLRDLQSWMFTAGASHTLIGNYLTTTGRNPQDDLTMIDDLGLSYEYGCEEKKGDIRNMVATGENLLSMI